MTLRQCRRNAAISAGVLTLVFCVSCSGSPSPSAVQPKNGPTPGPSKTAHRQQAVKPQKPVAVESNPPGDIPDNTQFVPYRSRKGHFVVSAPEGWSRRSSGSTVSFTDKLNSIAATWMRRSSAPTVRTAKTRDLADLKRTAAAFRLGHIVACAPSCTIPYSTAPITVTLPSGHATVITYYSNSAPNNVTGKRYRLEDLRFEFFKSGEEVDLTLSGPVGSDNVDPWSLVSQSFRWR
jgi:hypothetical protein